LYGFDCRAFLLPGCRAGTFATKSDEAIARSHGGSGETRGSPIVAVAMLNGGRGNILSLQHGTADAPACGANKTQRLKFGTVLTPGDASPDKNVRKEYRCLEYWCLRCAVPPRTEKLSRSQTEPFKFSLCSRGLGWRTSNRGKSAGIQAVAQRCLIILGRYGRSDWPGMASLAPR
jgi:hypothetical protein